MKKLVLSYILILICLLSNGQNTAVYNWQEHLSYQNAKKVINTSNHIFCSTKNGVFSYDKENYYLTKLNKTSGLSDVSVSELSYDEFTKCLIIAYENCNVDLVSENEVTNISDIKDKLILGQKKINDISIYNNTAYISTTFGIVLLDLEKEEIKETYNLYENGLPLKINECKINDTSIFAATNNGCYYADINSSQLFDFNSWKKIDGSTGDIKNIVFNSYGIVTNENGQNNFIDQDNNITFGALDDQLFYYLNDSSALSTISDSNFNYIQDAKFDQEQNIWIADSASSLIKFTNESFSEIIKPSGPSYNYAEKITLNDHKLFMIHNQNKNSISWSEDLLQWNMKNNIINATCVNSIGNDYYYGTSSKGLIQEDNQSNIIQLNLNNTNNILDSNSKIVDLKIDASGVLWGTETNSSNPLFCKDQENNWHSFIMPFVASSTSNIGEMIIDNYNQKWGIIYGSGIFVYNDNGTLENKEDDQFTKLTTAVGSGNLPDKNVYCMANDLEGDVWVGTKSGICVF